jgi:2,5-furandicarboxylate decarboxylase 1
MMPSPLAMRGLELSRFADLDLARLLPVPTWFEREGGPYITAGVIVAKDPDTGRRNVSIARLRLEGGARLMAGIALNHHLYRLAQKATAMGRPLEIAVSIGNHTAVLLASQMYLDLGEDEFAIAGGFFGEPVRLLKCKTVDLEVPAETEIVLEGLLRPDELIEEGPVSEFPGFYVRYGPGLAYRRHLRHPADGMTRCRARDTTASIPTAPSRQCSGAKPGRMAW